MPHEFVIVPKAVSCTALICLLLVGCSESSDLDSAGPNTVTSAATGQPDGLAEAKHLPAPPVGSRPLGIGATDVLSPKLPNDQTVSDMLPARATDEDVLQPPTAVAVSPSKSKREPIYLEEANGKELIAAALKKAQRDHKHVLIEWGGNWCGWCYKLHDVFHNDAEVKPIVYEEYELVLIDSQTNRDLMLEYGGSDREYSYPHLTVLDEHGEVLTNQETGSLEEGPKHDPKLVAQFLTTRMPAKVDAERLLADSLKRAADEEKCVLIRVGDPYCGWCKVLAQFVQDHESIISTDYVDIKIDTLRMTNGKEVAARYEPKKQGGVPWMVILDASGKERASSSGPEGNIGYPYQPNEIAHFITMLRDSRQKLTDTQLETISADLHAYREQREAKRD